MSNTAKNPLYLLKLNFEHPLFLLRDVLTLYSTVQNISKANSESPDTGEYSPTKTSKHLRPRLVDVLIQYIHRGYSKETKEEIKRVLKIDTKNLNQINAELTRKGYLIKDKYNDRKKEINSELQKLRDYFVDRETNEIQMYPLWMAINFNHKEVV